MDIQGERGFQKQKIFQNAKQGLVKKRSNRWFKDIGLGFKTPKEAIEGHYIDKKCPFTGQVSIRGRVLSGKIIKMKMTNTIIVRREFLHFVRKYSRFEKRHRNISVHMSPCFIDAELGDTVTIGECRPLSKTVRFNVVRMQKAVTSKAKQFKKF